MCARFSLEVLQAGAVTGLKKPLKCHQGTRGAHHLGTAAPSSTVGTISTTAKGRAANAASVFTTVFLPQHMRVCASLRAFMCSSKRLHTHTVPPAPPPPPPPSNLSMKYGRNDDYSAVQIGSFTLNKLKTGEKILVSDE